jgi:hypothetical protein
MYWIVYIINSVLEAEPKVSRAVWDPDKNAVKAGLHSRGLGIRP